MFSLITLLFLLRLMGMAFSENTTRRVSVGPLLQGNSSQGDEVASQGAKIALSVAAEAVDETLKRIPGLEEVVFSHCIEPPNECPNENITFWFFSRSSPDASVQILVSDPDTFNRLPRNQDPWKIIIHGYTKSKDEIPNPQLRSAYFKRGDYNLISVDYEPIARSMCYIQAVHNVPLIAKCTAQLIDALIARNFFDSKSLHVIGFSLGAQVAGTIHEYMEHGKPGRVTGLDAASPLFDGVVNHKLTKDSGDFVDVIHTNAMANGKLETAGHIDFYVNGGLLQPGCTFSVNETSAECSHNRAPIYYAESINSKEGFWGIPCSSYLRFYSGNCDTTNSNLVQMGEFVPQTSGVYYLETNSESPFALGKRSRASLI